MNAYAHACPDTSTATTPDTSSGSPPEDMTAVAIRAVALGRPEGWRFLDDRYLGLVRAQVLRQAGRKLLQRESLDDLVAEVLLEMVRDLPRLEYRGPQAFVGWIVRLVRNRVMTRGCFRSAGRTGPG
jgi:hypothetical protein